MKWFRFQKVKNKMRTYFLSERELAEAFELYIRGSYKFVQPEPLDLIREFIASENGLDAAIKERLKEIRIETFLYQVLKDYNTKRKYESI